IIFRVRACRAVAFGPSRPDARPGPRIPGTSWADSVLLQNCLFLERSFHSRNVRPNSMLRAAMMAPAEVSTLAVTKAPIFDRFLIENGCQSHNGTRRTLEPAMKHNGVEYR